MRPGVRHQSIQTVLGVKEDGEHFSLAGSSVCAISGDVPPKLSQPDPVYQTTIGKRTVFIKDFPCDRERRQGSDE
jgi:hypothetical protein